MKQARTSIKPYIRQFYRGNIGYLILSVFSVFFAVAASLMTAWLLQLIIDMIGGVDIGFNVGEVVGLVVLCIMLSMVSDMLRYFSQPRFIAKASLQYKSYAFSKLTQKGISAFSGENTSTYLSALSNDVSSIETGYLSQLYIILYNVIVFFGALIMMLCYDPLLTLISIGVAILPFAISILSGSFLARSEKRVSDKNESYISTLKDSLAGFAVIKSFHAEQQTQRLFTSESKGLADATERRRKISIIINMFGDMARFMLQFGVLLVGTALALSGSSRSAGSVLVFVQLLNYIINPIGEIPQALAQCKASRALIEKLACLISDNVLTEGTVEKSELCDKIALRQLSFSYEDGKKTLDNISFDLQAGKSYCIVGASGSGKSTLLNLLMASHGDFEGSICYDGIALRDLKSESLYDMVSQIQQNVFIFNASIRDNITMFSDFPQEDIDRAIVLSGLSRLIEEKGEDYLCGENGNGLSGGERQRISIARTLLKKSQVLLVDEATAALDAETAYQVSSAILGLHDMTRIVVTHALDGGLLSKYDCILTLKNGRIEESGSFEELIDRKGYFYSLYTVSQ